MMEEMDNYIGTIGVLTEEDEIEKLEKVCLIFEEALLMFLDEKFKSIEELYEWVKKSREDAHIPMSDVECARMLHVVEQTDAYITDEAQNEKQS